MPHRRTNFAIRQNVIVGRIIGEPSEAQLRECQNNLVTLVKDSGENRVLYDTRRMTAPSVDVVLTQRTLDQELADVRLRRAIVVATTRIGYLAGLAFGHGGEYRVFYNDTAAALSWLTQGEN